MDYDFKVNEKFPIGRFGKRFKIIGKKNIDGFIDFTDSLGHCYSQGLRKYDYCDFNIEEMRENGTLTFDPCFIEYVTEDVSSKVIGQKKPLHLSAETAKW